MLVKAPSLTYRKAWSSMKLDELKNAKTVPLRKYTATTSLIFAQESCVDLKPAENITDT